MYAVNDPALWKQRMLAWSRGDDRWHGPGRDHRGRLCEDWVSDGVVRCRRVRVVGGWLHYCDRGQTDKAARWADGFGKISFKPRPEQLAHGQRPPPPPDDPWVEPP